MTIGDRIYVVNLNIVQNGNSEIETRSPPESWKKFITAIIIIAIFEILFFSIPKLFSPSTGFVLITIIYAVIFVPNLFLGPLAFLWFGTFYSPADKKLTCYTIATILSVIVIYIIIKPSLAHDPENQILTYLRIGIFYAGIIWILAIGTYRRLTWAQKRSEKQVEPAVVTLGEGCMIVVFVLLILFTLSFFMHARRPAWMSRAKGTLRSTGSSQLAYQGTNNDKNFGSFQGLQDSLYIAEGYNLGNMIENYSMTWTVYNTPSMDGESSGIQGIHTFTIVAYPRDTYPGYLLTFGITEDQVVRVYNPDSVKELNEYNGLYDPRVWTWDPIL